MKMAGPHSKSLCSNGKDWFTICAMCVEGGG